MRVKSADSQETEEEYYRLLGENLADFEVPQTVAKSLKKLQFKLKETESLSRQLQRRASQDSSSRRPSQVLDYPWESFVLKYYGLSHN